jgi:hypothetical protein
MSAPYGIRSNSVLARVLGPDKTALVLHGLGAFERILPHVETRGWKVRSGQAETRATSRDASRRELKLILCISIASTDWAIEGELRRRSVPLGAGAISRTLDRREQQLATGVLKTLDALLQEIPPNAAVR